MSGTPMQFGDVNGRFQTVAVNINATQNCKAILCTVAGLLYVPTPVFQQTPTEAAFGTWEFWIYKGADANTLSAGVVCNSVGGPGAGTMSGYWFYLLNSESVGFSRITGGAATILLLSSVALLANTTWHKIRITRTTSGIFTVWANDTIVNAALGGSNPTAADVTHTVSSHVVFDMDAGDMIAWSCPSGERAIFKGVTT